MAANLFISNSDNSMKMNQYIKFIKNVIIILAVLIIADQITGYLMRRLYFNMVAGENYRETFTIDSTKSEIVVFGSSRASHHYVPELFEEKFKMSFYNAGRDGNFFLSNYAAFKAVTKRYSPKLVIFDINPNELMYRKSDYEGLASLLPYYRDHPELRDIIELRSPFEKYKMYSAVYPFNSQLVRIIFRNLSKTPETYQKGYLPLFHKMNETKANNALIEPTGEIDKNKINALNDIAIYCKKKNIKLAFVCSPVFSNSKEIFGSKIIEEITQAEQSHYLDFSTDSVFDNHPEYFQDNIHLNDEGAKLFSTILSNEIYKLMNHISVDKNISMISLKTDSY
jgi:hypothetical protein